MEQEYNKIFSREIICNVHCDFDESVKLNDLQLLQKICVDALNVAHCEIVPNCNSWYQFSLKDNTLQELGGITGVIILQESHFHISTWPEDNYFQLNINTCGDKAKPMRALHEILRNFDIKDYSFNTIERR